MVYKCNFTLIPELWWALRVYYCGPLEVCLAGEWSEQGATEDYDSEYPERLQSYLTGGFRHHFHPTERSVVMSIMSALLGCNHSLCVSGKSPSWLWKSRNPARVGSFLLTQSGWACPSPSDNRPCCPAQRLEMGGGCSVRRGLCGDGKVKETWNFSQLCGSVSEIPLSLITKFLFP